MEEAGTMNVFFRINDTLFTAPVSERILDGVTRKSIIDVAKKEGIEVDVRPVLVSELVEASKDGTLKYLVQVLQPWLIRLLVSPIKMCITNYQKSKILCGTIKRLTNIQHKLAEDTFGWTVKV
jgi:branched-chain amino acid aminotransferase